MRHAGYVGLLALFGFASCFTTRAQTACAPTALHVAASRVIAIRHTLHRASVPELDPRVPPAIATQLAQLKDALAHAAEAAFACADPSASADDLQNKLADALHANLSEATETVLVTRDHRDLGAYGSDLSVQVLPMNNTPRFVQVDFRYGVECGDDNLLMIFEAGHASNLPGAATDGWNERLRWSASGYRTVADALGDFVLLTPLSGTGKFHHWRFVVAHGQPGCAAKRDTSRFDLDLLAPSEDPAQPHIAWHLERAYHPTDASPRLATTEETLDFEIGGSTSKNAQAPAAQRDVYRYRIALDNTAEPLGTTPDPEPATPSAGTPQ